MGFEETFKELSSSMLNTIKQVELVKKTGIPQSTIGTLKKNPDRQVQLPIVAKFIDSLTDDEFVELVKKVRPHISWAVSQPGYHEVATYDIIGAKTVADLTPDRRLFTLRIPEKYFPGDFAVLFSGSSMNKIVPDRAAAGITKQFDLRPGEIYLCALPVEGLTLKRVIFHPDQNKLEFKADTYDSIEQFPSHMYDIKHGEQYVVGKLTWVSSRRQHV